jgi:hypothetical protein
MGGVITEIRHLKAMDFSSCIISVCSRNCNKLAHGLASLGCNLPGGLHATWDNVPQSLEGLVSSDSAMIRRAIK